MLCTNCNKQTAVYHYKTIINGSVHEQHLCADCAAKAKTDTFTSGFDSLLSDNFFDNSFFGNFFAKSIPSPAQTVCPFCGSTQRDISRTGQAGCAQCYDTFSSMLLPYIRRIHGSDTHKGKVPADAAEKVKTRSQLTQLQQQLTEAIDQQRYEDAAALRDRINQLKGGLAND